MPGSGITSENILAIAKSTGAVEFHSSASINKQSPMEYVNGQMNELLNHVSVNGDEVKKMSSLLHQAAQLHAGNT